MRKFIRTTRIDLEEAIAALPTSTDGFVLKHRDQIIAAHAALVAIETGMEEVMQIGLFRCDLCQREHRPSQHWEDSANGGAFTVCRDGINGARHWEHLCPSCRYALCTAIESVVKQRTPR